jgi:hypothetical protein
VPTSSRTTGSRPPPSADLTADWRIRDAVHADLIADWAIGGSSRAGASLTIDYRIRVARRIVIRYDGLDITSHVRFKETYFTSLTNGAVGTASILIRDDAFAFSFSVGKVIELLIDDVRVWYGFGMKVHREYPFEYENLAVPHQPAALPADRRRRHQHPVRAPDRLQAGRPGRSARAALQRRQHARHRRDPRAGDAGWLDLSGDNLDVSTLVEHVGAINVDQPARPFGAAEKWYWAMQSIAMLPAAVFYINPQLKLVYTDVDTPSNSMVLSDQPTRSPTASATARRSSASTATR